MNAMLSTLYTPGWIAAHATQLNQIFQQAQPIPEYAQGLYYLASEGYNTWNLLPTINAPTLIIHGINDVINPTANAATHFSSN